MDVGLCLPYMERDLSRERLLRWFRGADAGPFSSLSCGERITGYTVELRTTLAAAAIATERVRIVPTLYVLPMTSAVRAAKEIATLDLLSEGRVSVTVGVGGRPDDYRAVDASMERRQARMAEGVEVMRRIWRGQPPFAGADPVGPRPVQQPGPPVLAGVMRPKATRRAAAWADGFYLWSGNGEKREIANAIETAMQGWQTHARTGRPRLCAGFWFSLADDAAARLERYVYEYVVGLGEGIARAMSKSVTRSSPDAVREALDSMEALGCDECFLVPASSEPAEFERAAEVVARR